MSTSHPLQHCSWPCAWKGTKMCAQCLLNSQSLADRRVSFGVLCGLKAMYQEKGLPPCIIGNSIDWSGQREAVNLMAVMA